MRSQPGVADLIDVSSSSADHVTVLPFRMKAFGLGREIGQVHWRRTAEDSVRSGGEKVGEVLHA